jgi:hypothetical protein
LDKRHTTYFVSLNTTTDGHDLVPESSFQHKRFEDTRTRDVPGMLIKVGAYNHQVCFTLIIIPQIRTHWRALTRFAVCRKRVSAAVQQQVMHHEHTTYFLFFIPTQPSYFVWFFMFTTSLFIPPFLG